MNASLLFNYLTIALRQALRDKLSTTTSIVGLGLGIAATYIIASYAAFEKSYDTFHDNYDNIYRVTTSWNPAVTPEDRRATTVQWSGPGVKSLFPEVENFTRVMPVSKMTGDNAVQYGEVALGGSDIILADPGFLTMFSFPLLNGDVSTALNEPRSVLITESIAKAYFKESDPVGKALTIDTHGNLTGNDFKITGVIADAPPNSHFRYDFVVSFSSMWEGLNNGSTYWHWDNTYCYLLLHPEADVVALGKKISQQRVQLFASEMEGWNDKIEFQLQPLRDIHLYSSLKSEIGINGNGKYLDFLLILAACILMCSCINHINLWVAKVINRQTEIGVRKVTGSTRSQLIIQFVVETLLIALLAVSLAVVATKVTVPFLETAFSIAWPAATSMSFVNIIAIAVIVMLIVSMIYPASIIRSVNPAAVLKASKLPGHYGWSLRRYLIVGQFFFCIVFTAGTWILFSQLEFMRNHDAGFDREQVLVVKGYGFQDHQSFQVFKQALSNRESIAAIGKSSAAPGDEVMDLGLRPRISIAGAATSHEVKLVTATDGFFDALDVRFVAGRNFNETIPTDKGAVIINEATARLLGFTDPAQSILAQVNGLAATPLTIVGVIRNYNQRSFKTPYEPIIFTPSWVNDYSWNKEYYFVKLRNNNDVLGEIASAWKAVAPALPFIYFYLDDHFEAQYHADQSFIGLFTVFSVFTVFITLLGLAVVVASIASQRTREIGIRKVFGATLRDILALLSSDFAKMIAIASVVAMPVVFMIAREWLHTFAFRINLDLELFAAPLAVLIATILLIVAIRSSKAALANPVDSLRHE